MESVKPDNRPKPRRTESDNEAASNAPASTDDPILVKVREHIEQHLPPAMKDAYMRIVVAGMHLIFSDKTRPLMQQVTTEVMRRGASPELIANVMVNVLSLLYRESKGNMRIEAAYPAGITLMTYVLSYLQHAHHLTITSELVKAIGSAMAQRLKQVLSGERPPTPAQPAASPNAPTETPPPTAPGLVSAAGRA